MATITFDASSFRAAFPAFENPTTYTDATLQFYFNNAICIISDNSAFGSMQDTTDNQPRSLCLNLLTAHIAVLMTQAAAGQQNTLVTQSTVDKVSVTLEPPPADTEFQWWLSLTPYGLQIRAILQTFSVGGFYFGGRPELSAFRKVGGCY